MVYPRLSVYFALRGGTQHTSVEYVGSVVHTCLHYPREGGPACTLTSRLQNCRSRLTDAGCDFRVVGSPQIRGA